MSDFPDSISFPADERGHLGREFLKEDCLQKFHIKLVDDHIPEKHFCPTCGTNEAYDQFWTQEQSKKLESVVHRGAESMVGNMLDNAFKSSTNVTIKITGSPSSIFEYGEEVLGDVYSCPDCKAEFSMDGDPKFCISCGGEL